MRATEGVAPKWQDSLASTDMVSSASPEAVLSGSYSADNASGEWNKVVYAGTRTGPDSTSESVDTDRTLPDDSEPAWAEEMRNPDMHPMSAAETRDIELTPGSATEFWNRGLTPMSANRGITPNKVIDAGGARKAVYLLLQHFYTAVSSSLDIFLSQRVGLYCFGLACFGFRQLLII